LEEQTALKKKISYNRRNTALLRTVKGRVCSAEQNTFSENREFNKLTNCSEN